MSQRRPTPTWSGRTDDPIPTPDIDPDDEPEVTYPMTDWHGFALITLVGALALVGGLALMCCGVPLWALLAVLAVTELALVKWAMVARRTPE